MQQVVAQLPRETRPRLRSGRENDVQSYNKKALSAASSAPRTPFRGMFSGSGPAQGHCRLLSLIWPRMTIPD